MAAVVSSSFNSASSRPHVSSPLATQPTARPQPRPVLAAHAKRASLSANPGAQPAHLFPTSRPLRPFPSIANVLARPAVPGTEAASGRKGPKIIEAPKNFKSEFVLNLTQAELSRQD